MTLHEALEALAKYLNLDAVQLISYADSDAHGGRDTGWSVMSMTRDEGRILYALTRALAPATVIEIGTAEGCSATHFLQAIADNGVGQVISVDPDPQAGRLVPAELRARWQMRCADGVAELADYHAADRTLILEDSIHQYEHTCAVLTAALALNPVLLVCHDVLEYPGVFQAWAQLIGFRGLAFRVGDAAPGMGFYAGARV